MKAKAERREVQPAAVTADPVPAVREVASDDEAYDQRRVASLTAPRAAPPGPVATNPAVVEQPTRRPA